MNYLRKQQKAIKSDQLSALMIRMSEDHFVKVRGMIKDMIAKLEADASAEADQKAWCDTEMKEATAQRDDNIGAMEGDLASKTSAEAKIAKLENQKTLADANAGLAGVKKAMKILKDFYDNAFLQTDYKPPKGDASGNTVGDLAPDSFSGDFSGNQDAASGII